MRDVLKATHFFASLRFAAPPQAHCWLAFVEQLYLAPSGGTTTMALLTNESLVLLSQQPALPSVPTASTFYVATWDCQRDETTDTRCFTELADAAAFLMGALLHRYPKDNGADSQYEAVRAALRMDALLRTGGVVWAEYGEMDFRCSLYSRERLLAALPALLPVIGMGLHSR